MAIAMSIIVRMLRYGRALNLGGGARQLKAARAIEPFRHVRTEPFWHATYYIWPYGSRDYPAGSGYHIPGT